MPEINKCPYCYQTLGVWHHDPILLSNGSKYAFVDDRHLIEVPNIDERIYKGIYQITAQDLLELQDNRKELEDKYLNPSFEKTVFSPIDSSGHFQITQAHIKELRLSTEKIIYSVGYSMYEYFNYDENNNIIISPKGIQTYWTDYDYDPDYLLEFQIKLIHIEELRHYIRLYWLEPFTVTPTEILIDVTHTHNDPLSGSSWEWEKNGNTFSILGNRGLWRCYAYKNLSCGGQSFLEPINGYSKINQNIIQSISDINDSKKIKLYIDSIATTTTYQTFDEIHYEANRRVYVEDTFYLSSLGSGFHKITNNTYLAMDSIDSISYSGTPEYCGDSCQILRLFFDTPGRGITYVKGKSGSIPSPDVTVLSWSAFNRNIGQDYINKYGSLPSGERISEIRFQQRLAYFAGGYGNPIATGTMSWILDNIKLYELT